MEVCGVPWKCQGLQSWVLASPKYRGSGKTSKLSNQDHFGSFLKKKIRLLIIIKTSQRVCSSIMLLKPWIWSVRAIWQAPSVENFNGALPRQLTPSLMITYHDNMATMKWLLTKSCLVNKCGKIKWKRVQYDDDIEILTVEIVAMMTL